MITSVMFLVLIFIREIIAYPMHLGFKSSKFKISNNMHYSMNGYNKQNTERFLFSTHDLSHESTLTSFKIADADISGTGTIVFSLSVLLVAAGVFYLQYTLFVGKQGLGAFLSDGKGFKNSGFKPLSKSDVEKKNSERGSAMKLWKLPKFSYVETFDDDDDSQDSPSTETDQD
jgi:hypothetical protein